MSAKIVCPKNHSTKKISPHDAAIALSQGRSIGACGKCGQELKYRLDHADSSGDSRTFIVTHAIRLQTKARRDSYDTFLLVLRDEATGRERVLPTFWEPEAQAVRGGQLPPLLSLKEWKSLFSELDAEFSSLEERIRLRAYELYERRGRQDGHAVEDWLQAEAEIAAQPILRAAA